MIKQQGRTFWVIAAAAATVAFWLFVPGESALKQPSTWQRLTEPGSLSSAHTHLEHNCAACHTAVSGVETWKCVVCHANNESILQRQPTAFHASISDCTPCHLEHRGTGQRPTNMDHEALARIGRRQLNSDAADSESKALAAELGLRSRKSTPPHRNISASEATLECATCHANEDRHVKLFGQDCAQCHATDRWTIADFRHPSATSKDCAQCHQAPPSHYMMHFKMVSARVAGRPNAVVNQCFECHQTTSWNDIRGAGWYKHH